MIDIYKKILCLLGKNKKHLPFIFAMMIIETLLEAIGISLVVPLISAIMDENILTRYAFIGRACSFLNIETHRSFIIFCIISLIVVYALKCFFTLYECRVRYDFICRSRHHVQKRIYASILERPYEFFLNTQSSEIIREVADDCNRTFSLVSSILDVFANLLLTVGIVGILFVIDAKMTIIVVLMMAVLSIVLITIIKPTMKKYGDVLIKYSTKNYQNVLEAVQGIKVIKISKCKDYFNNEFAKNGEKVIEAQRIETVINRIPFALTEFICVGTVLIYVLVLLMNNTNINDLIPVAGAFVVASVKLIPSAKKTINAYSEIAFCRTAVDKVYDNYCKACFEPQKAVIEKMTLKKSIELHDVTYKYPNTDRKILDNTSLTIPIGKSVGIIGLSGIGKTTAADVLLGLLSPEKGSIVFDGEKRIIDIENYPINIGYVPQSIYIRDDTIRNNIAFGIQDQDISDKLIKEVIKAAQLEDFIESLPDGVYTSIGENGVRISGGQKQRIGIARALYNNPDLLVFDEATSSLDLETEASVLKAIEALQGKKTMIIIAHRPQVVEMCDYIYRMVDGKFVYEYKKNS